jgi:hypothetical protein
MLNISELRDGIRRNLVLVNIKINQANIISTGTKTVIFLGNVVLFAVLSQQQDFQRCAGKRQVL